MEGACLKKCIMDANLGVSTNLEGKGASEIMNE